MVRKLSALLFLFVCAAGCATLLWRLLVQAPASAPSPPLAGSAWRDGGVSAALDRRVRLVAPASAALDDALHGLLYALAGDTGPQVRPGCPGWLFLAEESAGTPRGEDNLRQRLRMAELMQAELGRRGIALISVPVPDKVEQAAAQLCGLAVSGQARGRGQAWRAASASLANQIDLRAGWPAPGYWRTDTHWDRAGAAFAARRVAAAVLAILPPGDSVMRERVAPGPEQRVGDLARLAGLARQAPPFGPAPEYDRVHTLEIERAGALLDDVAAPQVLLAGSSYALNSGFSDALQLALRQEVSQQSRTGSGFAGTLLEVLAHPRRLDGVAVLVWEWPLRTLYQPLTAEESAWLREQAP